MFLNEGSTMRHLVDLLVKAVIGHSLNPVLEPSVRATHCFVVVPTFVEFVLSSVQKLNIEYVLIDALRGCKELPRIMTRTSHYFREYCMRTFGQRIVQRDPLQPTNVGNKQRRQTGPISIHRMNCKAKVTAWLEETPCDDMMVFMLRGLIFCHSPVSNARLIQSREKPG
jgi:hypothetical protein